MWERRGHTTAYDSAVVGLQLRCFGADQTLGLRQWFHVRNVICNRVCMVALILGDFRPAVTSPAAPVPKFPENGHWTLTPYTGLAVLQSVNMEQAPTGIEQAIDLLPTSAPPDCVR